MHPSRLTASLLSLVLCAAACDGPNEVAAPADAGRRFHFTAPRAAKADGPGTGFVDATALAEIEAALAHAIAQTETRIATLQTDIAALESRHQAKLSQIDNLLSQIASRKREIEQNMKAKATLGVAVGILGFFVGVPAFVFVSAASLASAIADDGRIRDLTRQLDQARGERASIEAQRASYIRQRNALMERLTPLRDAKNELLALLAGEPPIITVAGPLPYGASPELDQLAWRIETMRKVLDNNHGQIDLLGQIRALAADLDAVLGAALQTLEDVAEAADAMLAASNAELERIVALALSPDPAADALRWLEDLVAARTRELLAHYDHPIAAFVDFLIVHRRSSASEIVADLRDRLIERITNATTPEPVEPEPVEPEPVEPEPEVPVAPAPVATRVVLNEVCYDSPGADADVYVEIVGPPGSVLDGWAVVGVNGANGAPYHRCTLAGVIPEDGRFLLVHTGAKSPTLIAAADRQAGCDLQNGPDSVVLVDESDTRIDALAYGGFPEGTTFAAGEGLTAVAPAGNSGMCLTRAIWGGDTDDNSVDWIVAAPAYD